MAVHRERHRLAGPAAVRGRVVAGVALELPPAVVRGSAGVRSQRAVDLLVAILADVADPQVAGLAIEREAPRVAQAERPDEVVTRHADVGIRGRDRVRLPRVDVDPEDLAQQRTEALGAVAGIAGAAAVAHPDVEIAVGPEREHPAVVVRVGLRDAKDDLDRRGVGLAGVRRRSQVLRDHRVAVAVRVVDVELAVPAVVRVERQTEEAALAARRDLRAQVEERRRLQNSPCG